MNHPSNLSSAFALASSLIVGTSALKVQELLSEDFDTDDGGFVQEATGNTPIDSVYNGTRGSQRAVVPHRAFIAVCWDRHVVDGGSEVDSGGIGVGSTRCGPGFLLAGSFGLLVGHDASWCSVGDGTF